MCIYMYVCIYVYVHICVYIYVYIYVYICICVCICIHKCIPYMIKYVRYCNGGYDIMLLSKPIELDNTKRELQ